jgi:hypothetical protein
MRIQLADKSAALTPFGSVGSGEKMPSDEGRLWIDALRACRRLFVAGHQSPTDFQRTIVTETTLATALTVVVIAIIIIGELQSSLGGGTYPRQSRTSASHLTITVPLLRSPPR